MWEDPLIKEIHEHRRALLDRFDGDVVALFDHWQERQKKNGRKVVIAKENSAGIGAIVAEPSWL